MSMSHESLPLSLFRSAFLERGLQRVCAPRHQPCHREVLKPARCAKPWAHIFLIHMGHLKQRISTVFGTRDWFCGRQIFHWGGRGDGFRMIQVHYIFVHFISIIIISLGIRSWRLGTPDLKSAAQLMSQAMFSNQLIRNKVWRKACVCVCVCVHVFSCVQLFVAPWTINFTRFLCTCSFTDKDTGAVCHFLLQGIFLTQGSNPCLFHLCWQVDS